jgi:TetR/AcrR family transcriptional regulator, cholesterol catabolism regulator
MAKATSTQTRTVVRRAGADKRRPQILRAAAKLFQRNGYHATTMDDVAAAVKLNKATIYYHFPGGKTDLLYAINATALDELLARLQRLAGTGDAEERLRAAIEVMVRMQQDFPDETIVLHEETRWLKNVLSRTQHQEIVQRNAAVRAFVQQIIDDGIKRRVFANCDSSFVAAWIVNVAGSAFSFAHSTEPQKLPGLYVGLILSGMLRRSAGPA